MIPNLRHLNQEYEERLARSEALRLAAKAVRRRRARNALQRAMKKSVRSGLCIDELKREFVVFFERSTSQ